MESNRFFDEDALMVRRYIRPIKSISFLIILFLSCDLDRGLNLTLPRIPLLPPETGDGWETALPMDVGLDPEPLFDLERRLERTPGHEIHSVLIVKNNKLVYEKYYAGHDYNWSGNQFRGSLVAFDRNRVHNMHSVTKSFTSALVGIAIDRGYIESVDQKIFDFFPEYASYRTPGKDAMTIEHFLMMSAGLEWNEWELSLGNMQNDLIAFGMSPDPMGYILSKELIHTPGTVFYYNGALTNVLGQIVRRSAELKLDRFSGPRLFEPLGVTQYQWQYLRNGMTYSSGDIHIRPRDMAKFGQLFLDGGVWKGERIISQEWIDLSTTRHVQLTLSWATGYGYQWWMYTFQRGSARYDVFFASGWGGQNIYVFPELEMVCVFTGANYTSSGPLPPEMIVTNHILDALD